ncbi:MAG: transcriptional regulator [Geodermatophilaceae bacterium]|nr:transcriptional regulator [Geodermatophilaceae bacterium]
MTGRHRWALVACLVTVLVATPIVISVLPAAETDISAAELLQKVQDSSQVSYSGYAQSIGGVVLPINEQLPKLVELFADRTTTRVWWRGPEDWRVDTVDLTGETGVHRSGPTTWTWEYEANHATLTPVPELRTPRPDDLLPSELGRRLLSEADADEVTRLPAERVAGVDAQGLRLSPREPQSNVNRVDIWADPETGLALRVAVYGEGAAEPAVSTSFLDIDYQRPSPEITVFSPPPGARVQVDDVADIVAAVDRFADSVPPARLAGLDRREQADGLGSVGDYGRGVTVLVALPLWREFAEPLRRQLVEAPTADLANPLGTTVTVGPFSVLLTDGGGGVSYLLTGTVDLGTLERAARDLRANPPGVPSPEATVTVVTEEPE